MEFSNWHRVADCRIHNSNMLLLFTTQFARLPAQRCTLLRTRHSESHVLAELCIHAQLELGLNDDNRQTQRRSEAQLHVGILWVILIIGSARALYQLCLLLRLRKTRQAS